MNDISDYPWQRRTDYLMMVAAVAAADGNLPPEELALLDQWIVSFRLSGKSRARIMDAARREPPTLEKIQRRLATTDLI